MLVKNWQIKACYKHIIFFIDVMICPTFINQLILLISTYESYFYIKTTFDLFFTFQVVGDTDIVVIKKCLLDNASS